MQHDVLSYRSKGDIVELLNDHLKQNIKAYLRAEENRLVDTIGHERSKSIHSISCNGVVLVNSAHANHGVRIFFSDLSPESKEKVNQFIDYVDDMYRKLASAGSFIKKVVNKQAFTFGDIVELLPSFLIAPMRQNFNIPESLEYISDVEQIQKYQRQNAPKLALLAELDLMSSMVT
tara:strand:- start:3607 stop:4134 length:528 start_codon:yes stop_codon:yes gene_type:complete